MPKMIPMVVSNRTSPLYLILASGHSYVFRPNTPTNVHERHVAVCMERGVGFVTPADEPKLRGNIPDPKAPKTAGQINDAMSALFARMAANPTVYRDNFTATGRPNTKWVATQIGAEISAALVDTLWRATLAEQGATTG